MKRINKIRINNFEGMIEMTEKGETLIKKIQRILDENEPLTDDEIVEIETKFDKIDHMFKAVCASIETVFYKDSVIECNKEDRASVENLVGRLNKKQYSILEEFVEGQPTTQIDVSYRCPKCRKPHEKTLSGLSNFFF